MASARRQVYTSAGRCRSKHVVTGAAARMPSKLSHQWLATRLHRLGFRSRTNMKRAVAAMFFACGLSLAATVFAQHTATVVLRSGERVGGELIDYNASGFVMRVGGSDRTIPSGEVAHVEFAGHPLSPDQQSRLN